MSEFQGLSTSVIDNGILKLEYLSNAGPRIVRLSAFGKENLFADVPSHLSTRFGTYSFRGGHRLWHSPEAIPRTYIPDDNSIIVEELPDGVRLCGSPENGTGISKIMEIHMLQDQPVVQVNHILRNDNLWEIELAPWAVTMFQLGGIAILPQSDGKATEDSDSLWPNRNLALWPYTQINDPRLTLRDDFILIRGNPGLPPVKIGYFNPEGMIAYWLGGVLFRKTFDTFVGASYPDLGCNTEAYCNDQFLEVESLGPLSKLKPGESAKFDEKWELFPDLDVPFLSEEIVAELSLAPNQE
ncbi:MAG: hypothetical protein AB2L21_03430 [Anaerolineaceae bacterium]|jgi:hypothetical protein